MCWWLPRFPQFKTPDPLSKTWVTTWSENEFASIYKLTPLEDINLN